MADLNGMRARGHDCWLATRPESMIGSAASRAGIPVIKLPFTGKFDAATINGLRRLVTAERIEIVNTHSGIDTWNAAIAAKWSGALLVRTRHLQIPLRRRWYNPVHYLYDAVITCGEAMRRELIEIEGFPSHQVRSIPTGIDTRGWVSKADRVSMRDAIGVGVDDFVVLQVAVVRRVKGHDIALRAFARLHEQMPNARLVLAGDGPMKPAMQALGEELGISGALRWLGHRDDIADLMAMADVSLMTSRSEGIPQALTQSLAMGLPVVATAVGGVPEIVRDGETGLLVPAGDQAAIVRALAAVAHDPALGRRLGQRGRDFVRADFDIQQMLGRTESCYGELIERKRTGAKALESAHQLRD